MTPTEEEPPWMFALGGLIFLLFGVFVFVQAHDAAGHGTVVPGSSRTAWMSPTQAYFAGALCVAFGSALVAVYFRRRRSK